MRRCAPLSGARGGPQGQGIPALAVASSANTNTGGARDFDTPRSCRSQSAASTMSGQDAGRKSLRESGRSGGMRDRNPCTDRTQCGRERQAPSVPHCCIRLPPAQSGRPALRRRPDRATSPVRRAAHASKPAKREQRRSADPSRLRRQTAPPTSRRRSARNCAYSPGRAERGRRPPGCPAA
jgi:hypothetical protein